ncbi:SpaH/EbpB family LPXTG-anchored major pilin [Bifidobacterium pullorum subsp. saeculare]|nr:SpaH/EbpB family LPXTG-anchored major pilin [Bifidobacterium pullorum subsp. saeculare]
MKAKALALLAALAMMLGLGAVATAPAYAEGTDGSIAVTGNDGFQGIVVYQMFNEEGEGKTAKYVLNTAWNDFFTTGAGQGGIGLKATGEDLSDAAYTYVKGLGANNAQAVSDFAKKAAAWAAGEHGITETKRANVAENTKTATVSDLNYGYYLVVPNPKGSTDQTDPFRGTDAMLVNVNSNTPVKMELKTVYPTVDKKVEDNANHASASVGDTLDFTLTSTVPDISEYTKGYQFSFVDTLSEGLTFNEGSVHVMIGEEEVTSNCTIVNPSMGKNVLTIHFGTEKGGLSDGKYDATSVFTGKAGQKITVTYKATLNENAEIKVDQTNTVKVVYSNNPSTDATGESGESKTHQYTFGFDLKKTDGTNPLAGAQFQLKKQGEDNPIQLIETSEGSNTYRPAKVTSTEGPTYEPGAVSQVTTPEDGMIYFTGLAEGTYQLVETAAPEGYNKVADPINVTIEATYKDDGTLNTWSVKLGDEVQQDQIVEVVNHAGTLLPGTGGIGTVIFTVAGIVLIVAGVAWAMRRRRQRD